MNKHNPILDILDSKLYEYITKHLKVKFVRGTYFKCPTGKHNDTDASCRITPFNPSICYCFGCNTTMNIFQGQRKMAMLLIRG